jgi:hypothetical protein
MSLNDIVSLPGNETWKNFYVNGFNVASNMNVGGNLSVTGSINGGNLSSTLVLNVTASGIWATPQPITLYFSKSGKNVVMGYTAITSSQSGAGYVTISGITLPSAFTPSVNYNGMDSSGDLYYNVPLVDNGSALVGILQFSIETPPNLTIYFSTSTEGNYSGTGAGGFFCGSISYATD